MEGSKKFPNLATVIKHGIRMKKIGVRAALLETAILEIVDFFVSQERLQNIFVNLFKAGIVKNVHKVGIQVFQDFY